MSRSGVGGLDSTIYTMSLYFCYYGLFLLNVHITVIMTIVFMTTSGILQYDMIGYYLFVCMIYVIVIFLVYLGHCCFYSIDIFVMDYVMCHCLLHMLYVLWVAIYSKLYSIDIFVMDYVMCHCLLHMLYVLWVAIYSKLCRGVYAVMLFTPLHIVITNVYDPDLILIVYMLSVTGRLATLK